MSELLEKQKGMKKLSFGKKLSFACQYGGEGGIRTHVTTFGRQTDFESVPL